MDNLHEQFSSIYEQYIEKIYRFVYLKVNSQEVAEDISSKVFLKGWETYKRQETGDPPVPRFWRAGKRQSAVIENPGAYLYQIARNMVTDHYREKGKTKIVSADFSSNIVDPKVDIHEKAIFNADVEMVKSAIQNLKQEYQDVLIWHYLDDMPIAEIAQILEKPPGNVRVLLHRGLKSLKNELNEA